MYNKDKRQRQIVVLAFITALAQVAAGDSEQMAKEIDCTIQAVIDKYINS